MLRFLSLLIVALASVALGQQQQQKTSGSPTNGSPLDLTAISASGGSSTFECWRLNATFKSPTGAQTGPVGVPLGNLSATSYSIIPAGFDGGLHNAPSRQYVGMLPNGLDMTLTKTGLSSSLPALSTSRCRTPPTASGSTAARTDSSSRPTRQTSRSTGTRLPLSATMLRACRCRLPPAATSITRCFTTGPADKWDGGGVGQTNHWHIP